MTRSSRGYGARKLIAFAAAAAFVVAACGGDDDDAGSPDTAAHDTTGADSSPEGTEPGDTSQPAGSSPATTTGTGGTVAPEPGGELPEHDPDATIRYAEVFGLRALDPHKRVQRGDRQWQVNLYDGLLKMTKLEDGRQVPGPWLATSYTLSDDAMSYEFELRDDVTFQDGTHFNADAVKANIERAKTLPDSTVASIIATVDSVEVIDDTHVVFHMATPDPALPYNLANESVGLMISPAAFDTDLEATPVGSGPFKLVSAATDGDVVFERWDDYWDTENPALAKQVIISTVPDGNARLNGIRSGDFDIVRMFPPQDTEAFALQDQGYQWQPASQAGTNGLLINSALPPFDDVRVRQAVSMAIDRSVIVDSLGTAGLYSPLYQIFPEGVTGYLPELDDDPYDPDTARALISEAGAEGAKVVLIQTQLAPYDFMALVVQQALTDIGLDVELVPVAATEINARWALGQEHGIVSNWSGSLEPSRIIDISFFKGRDNPTDPPAELVEMQEAAKLLSGDAQRQAYEAVNRWLAENPIHIPIVAQRTAQLGSGDVVGLERWGLAAVDFRGIGIAP